MNGTENSQIRTNRAEPKAKGTHRDSVGFDVEQALLGCIMLDSNIFKNIQASTEDFLNPEYRQLYEVMTKIATDGLEITPQTIYNENPSLLKVLATIESDLISLKNYKSYDLGIREKSAKHKAVLHLRKLVKMSENGTPADVVLANLNELMRQMSDKIEGKKTLTARIDEWIESSHGTFYGKEMDMDLGIVTNRDKENRKKILQRLETKGRIVKASNRQSHYRIVDNSLEVINFKDAKSDEIFEVRWPFEIENWVKILPKSIIIVAGAWEAGKTAFLLNVAQMNMNRHHVRYMSSEMGDAEFALRLGLFVNMAPEDWKIEAIERSADWEDAILPDAINIIDYLELSDAFYNVGDKIRKIFDRLRKGIAVIALQKGTGKELGRGGDFTAEKARLYLSLDPGELTIVKGKLWANPQISPKNQMIKFKLWQGHKFVPQGEWYKKVKA